MGFSLHGHCKGSNVFFWNPLTGYRFRSPFLLLRESVGLYDRKRFYQFDSGIGYTGSFDGDRTRSIARGFFSEVAVLACSLHSLPNLFPYDIIRGLLP